MRPGNANDARGKGGAFGARSTGGDVAQERFVEVAQKKGGGINALSPIH